MTMAFTDLVVAVLPPTVTILIELFNPYNEIFFARQARNIMAKELSSPVANEVLLKQALSGAETLIRVSAEGTASLVGFAPTLLSFSVSGLALVLLLKTPAWWMIGLLIVALVMTLALRQAQQNRTLDEIAARPIERGPFRGKTLTRLGSWLIYFTNGSLILTAIVIFAHDWISAAADINKSPPAVTTAAPVVAPPPVVVPVGK